MTDIGDSDLHRAAAIILEKDKNVDARIVALSNLMRSLRGDLRRMKDIHRRLKNALTPSKLSWQGLDGIIK